jgi:hypothetical protein
MLLKILVLLCALSTFSRLCYILEDVLLLSIYTFSTLYLLPFTFQVSPSWGGQPSFLPAALLSCRPRWRFPFRALGSHVI